MSLKNASGAHAAYQLSLQWDRASASAHARGALYLTAAALAESGVEVQLGGLAVAAALSCDDHPQVYNPKTLK